MRRVLVDRAKFEPKKVHKVKLEKGAYLQRIQLHIKADVETKDNSKIYDGGIANIIKKVTLLADSDPIIEYSGRSGVLKDIFDYKTFKDYNRLDRQSIYLDLEDEEITEDGMISLLPTMHYSTVSLNIEFGTPEDVGENITINDAEVEIIKDEILPAELIQTLYEEIVSIPRRSDFTKMT